MTFRSGQKVVCVNDTPDPGRAWNCIGAHPQKGQVYTVRDYVQSHYGTDEPCIRLVEIIRSNDEHGFRAARFRPVVERKTDVGFAILEEIRKRETIPARERERAQTSHL